VKDHIVYNYTYTDCAGLSTPWSYTYTIDYSGGLTAPEFGNETVSCPDYAIDPGRRLRLRMLAEEQFMHSWSDRMRRRQDVRDR
jgi:hypothetical protein